MPQIFDRIQVEWISRPWQNLDTLPNRSDNHFKDTSSQQWFYPKSQNATDLENTFARTWFKAFRPFTVA